MLLGYARVSTDRQDHGLQLDALKSVGCTQIYEDTASGGKDDRPNLARVIAYAREGDVIVVWKLDRLGRSISHLIASMKELERKGVGFRSLTEAIDTTTPTGRLVFHIFAALSEFELSIIRQRTRAGLDAAKARGRIGGRPAKLNEESVRQARALMGDTSAAKVAQLLGVSRATLYRHLGS